MNKIKKIIVKLIFSAVLIAIIFGLNYLIKNPYVVEHVFARSITRFLSGSLALLTNMVPFSIGEIIVYLFVIFILITVIRIIKNLFKIKFLKAIKITLNTVNFLLIVVILNTVLNGVLYYREDSFKYLNIGEEVTLDSTLAKETAIYYVEYLKTASASLTRDEHNNVISPYTIEELNDIIAEEYKKLTTDNPYFSSTYNRVKPVQFSLGMSYLGIIGVYFPFTGESNINTKTFTYELPSTIAHELAHAKGVMKENEANFISYYICLTSNDPFLNYSGAMDAVNVMLGQLEETDYQEVVAMLPTEIRQEYSNATAYYKSYSGFIDELSRKINDLYLKQSGVVDGIKSYSRTATELASLYVYLNK
jgi:hypothetical protein